MLQDLFFESLILHFISIGMKMIDIREYWSEKKNGKKREVTVKFL